MDFDYSSIAPLKQQYFPLTATQSAILPVQQQMIKQQSAMLQIQNQELAFQRQQQDLENARRRARVESESLAALPELNKRLSIFDDPNMSTEELADAVGEITMEMAPLAAYNPAMEQLLRSAQSRVDARAKQDYRDQIKAERDEQRRYGLMSSAAQIGDVESVTRIAEADDEVDETERAYMGVAESYKKRQSDKLQREYQQEQDKLKEARRKELYDISEKRQSTLFSLKTSKDEELEQMMIAGSDEVPAVDEAGKPLELDKMSKLKLRELAIDLAPEAKDMIENEDISDADLLRFTFRLNSKALKALEPKGSKTDTSASAILQGWGS